MPGDGSIVARAALQVSGIAFAGLRGIQSVELSSDDLDGLYAQLLAKGVVFAEPPHDEPWERSMQCRDPDGYTVEIAQGRRGQDLFPPR